MTGPGGEGPKDGPAAQRLDKWLWYARVVKSRTSAAGLVTDGRIRVNKVRAEKPSHALKLGDVVTATVRPRVRILRVLGLGSRRGPPTEAATLYEELTPAPPEPKSPGAGARLMLGTDLAAGLTEGRPAGAGRPTKRDRRQIDRLKGGGV